jgi:hypothetical protein
VGRVFVLDNYFAFGFAVVIFLSLLGLDRWLLGSGLLEVTSLFFIFDTHMYQLTL